MQFQKEILKIDGERIVCEVQLRQKNAIILHGAGVSNRKRYYAFADELLRQGIGVVLFDFSGHGESTGGLHDLSLARRQIQACGVIDAFLDKQSTFYLIGFSMSGQTVCDLLSMYGSRVEAILLGCPGIYTKAVHGLVFGDSIFTSTIRQPASWEASSALAALREFEGRTIIAIGDNDDVIPPGVVTLLSDAAKHSSVYKYKDATHQLANWLSKNPDKLRNLVQELTK